MVRPLDWAEKLLPAAYTSVLNDSSSPEVTRSTYNSVRGSALETSTLLPCDAAISVESREVVFIGRALSQSRYQDDRATLKLVGVEIREPVADALLAQAFFTVCNYEFSSRKSGAGCDSDVWHDVQWPAS
ncbi:hypothetical protein AURDEDRAFT_163692 [Auricularia subglabra TFB-10046 SS5]|nr:hypothetical protein AURDEDRAFT_163692 [Auricularia subglabra TFB-10046 SS5]